MPSYQIIARLSDQTQYQISKALPPNIVRLSDDDKQVIFVEWP
jgi:hypothetical protein